MTALGRALAENGYNLVYGGGSSGLMGIVSDAVLEAGGDVTGIMPFAMSSGCGETNPASEVMDGLVTRRGKVGHLPSLRSQPHLTVVQLHTVKTIFQSISVRLNLILFRSWLIQCTNEKWKWRSAQLVSSDYPAGLALLKKCVQ